MSAERGSPPVTKGGAVLTDDAVEAGYDVTQASRVERLPSARPSPRPR